MSKPFAIVTGASSGIGLELAAICAQEGFALLVVALSTSMRFYIESVMKGQVASSTRVRFHARARTRKDRRP
jgi:short-subunit dehydrogenase